MEKYIKAVECAEIISKKFNIPLGDLVDAFAEIPTADVAPKSEVDKLEYTLMGVMHSVDKWLEGDELKQDEVNRAATMREKTLQIIENAKGEGAREIFEDIENHCDHIVVHLDTNASPETFKSVITQVCDAFADVLAELKKKHLKGDGAGL